ncbi:efflux RND transporter permease subunit [Bifidobacterium vespertilionis]|uniref:efflux RND transporter permease subunit n=1 Tax=Bifidobacterium vespertilionis TaxID=2562524 RepID=UPI001BDD06A6|nr:MMPL family transporter [Bifidobacterium vespertilionis]
MKSRLGIGRLLLRHRRWVIAVFALFTVLGAFAYPQVKVNYSMADYLPQDSPSVVSLNDMKAAFGAGVPNARLYAEGISQAQADRLADDLADIDGVDEVMWLGSVVDVKTPAAVQDADTVSSWKTDDGYLYQLTIDSAKAVDAIAHIRAAATNDGASAVSMSGDGVTTAEAQSSTGREILIILVVAVAIVVGILLLTSHSWFEPVIFLIVIGVAIVMNMGSNIVMGEISFISQICGAILQLAVSMDYAIVLLHTFRRVERDMPSATAEEAMAEAMRRSFVVILSSAAVTFFGFLSLTVMRFGIGVNMGVVLAKGIVFSFLSIMLLMPCLILALLKPLNALEHRYLMPSFSAFAKACMRVALPAAIAIAVMAVPSYLAQDRNAFIYGASDFASPGSSVRVQADHIEEAFGKSETWVIMVPEGRWADEQALQDEVEQLPHVSDVTSYISEAGRAMPVDIVPESQREQIISNGWSRLVVSMDVETDSDDAYALVPQMRETAARHYGDDYRLVGTSVSTYDLRDVVRDDSARVRFFSLGSIALVLMIMFRSLSIPFVVLLAIEASIWINLAIPYFTGDTLNYIGYLVIDAVQLGAAVDYGIIYTREYLDWRRRESAREATEHAIGHSAVTILTSASILAFAGLAVQMISSNGVIGEIGMLISRGALLAMLMMFLLLPWLFRVCDGLIRRTSIGLDFAK